MRGQAGRGQPGRAGAARENRGRRLMNKNGFFSRIRGSQSGETSAAGFPRPLIPSPTLSMTVRSDPAVAQHVREAALDLFRPRAVPRLRTPAPPARSAAIHRLLGRPLGRLLRGGVRRPRPSRATAARRECRGSNTLRFQRGPAPEPARCPGRCREPASSVRNAVPWGDGISLCGRTIPRGGASRPGCHAAGAIL